MFSAIADTGPLVHALLSSPPAKKVIGVNEWLSFEDFTKILATVLGKSTKFIDSNPVFDVEDPELEQEYLEMMGFCIEFGFDGGKVDKSIVRPVDLEVSVQLDSVKEWCSKQTWDEILEG